MERCAKMYRYTQVNIFFLPSYIIFEVHDCCNLQYAFGLVCVVFVAYVGLSYGRFCIYE